MSTMFGRCIIGLSFASMLAAAGTATASTSVPSAAESDGPVTLLTELKFNSTTLSAPGWGFGAQHGGAISVQQTPGPTSGPVYALVGSYPAPGLGGQFIWADYTVAALNTEDLYIEFWAQMPGVKEGCKFLKIFGVHPMGTNSYADMTFATNYAGGDYGALRQVTFGDGTAIPSDGQNAINLDGSYPTWIGRSYGTASVQTPQMHTFSSADWGSGWHHFRVHLKFNSGTSSQNEVPDGEVYLEIDGKVYVNATGLYNRNPANGPIDRVEFFGWAQSEPQPFRVVFSDIRISTGGFITSPIPMPPTSVAIN